MNNKVFHEVSVKMIEYPEGSMFLQTHVGEATLEDGGRVSIGLDVSSGSVIFQFLGGTHRTYAFTARSMLEAVLTLYNQEGRDGGQD